MNFIMRIVISALAVILADILLSGVHLDNYGNSLLVALVLTFLNAILKPLLIIITIPVTFLTLGLFLFVINATIILVADYAIDGFEVDGFWWAMAFSFLLSLITAVFNSIHRNGGNKGNNHFHVRIEKH
jgi:putative membrane protein